MSRICVSLALVVGSVDAGGQFIPFPDKSNEAVDQPQQFEQTLQNQARRRVVFQRASFRGEKRPDKLQMLPLSKSSKSASPNRNLASQKTNGQKQENTNIDLSEISRQPSDKFDSSLTPSLTNISRKLSNKSVLSVATVVSEFSTVASNISDQMNRVANQIQKVREQVLQATNRKDASLKDTEQDTKEMEKLIQSLKQQLASQNKGAQESLEKQKKELLQQTLKSEQDLKNKLEQATRSLETKDILLKAKGTNDSAVKAANDEEQVQELKQQVAALTKQVKAQADVAQQPTTTEVQIPPKASGKKKTEKKDNVQDRLDLMYSERGRKLAKKYVTVLANEVRALRQTKNAPTQGNIAEEEMEYWCNLSEPHVLATWIQDQTQAEHGLHGGVSIDMEQLTSSIKERITYQINTIPQTEFRHHVTQNPCKVS